MNVTSGNNNWSDNSDDVPLRKYLTLGNLHASVLTPKKVRQKNIIYCTFKRNLK